MELFWLNYIIYSKIGAEITPFYSSFYCFFIHITQSDFVWISINKNESFASTKLWYNSL